MKTTSYSPTSISFEKNSVSLLAEEGEEGEEEEVVHESTSNAIAMEREVREKGYNTYITTY